MQRRLFLTSVASFLTGSVAALARRTNAPPWAAAHGADDYGFWADLAVAHAPSLRFRWIPPGDFLMGSPAEEPRRKADEGPQREVRFAKGFWMAESCIPQRLYEAVIGENPSTHQGPDLPVETISFEAAEAFTRELRAATPDLHLRLPSESEWEYACRAGAQTPFATSIARRFDGISITSDEVNYRAQAPYLPKQVAGSPQHWRRETVAVTQAGFRPNSWGLWHMHGNVFEWCLDHKSDSLADHPQDGRPYVTDSPGPARAVRGGAWNIYGRRCRSAARGFLYGAFAHVGFRCVVT